MITETQIENFRVLLENMIQFHIAKNYKNLPPEFISIEPGKKNARIVRHSKDNSTRSAYGFISLENGDLLKAAGWTAPAKHARGNILNDNPLNGCGPYGMTYLK
jgi:hypothetical protein